MIPQKAINIVVDLWPMVILISVVLITVRLTFLVTNHKKIIIYKELISLSFVLYIVLLFSLVTTSDFESFSNNFIPFKEIFRYKLTSKLFYRNVIGNIMLFIPFGYFVSYYIKVKKKWFIPIIITMITSLTIELIQMGIGRSFDVDDILLNVIGGLFGFICYFIGEKIFSKYNEIYKNNLLLNFICIIIIIVLSFIILNLYGVR